MKINAKEEKGITIISIEGKLDSNTSPEANTIIGPFIKPGAKLVLNLEKCDYVSSAGLRVLLTAAKMLARSGGKGVLSGLSNDIKEVMDLTGFGSMFPNFSTVGEAVAALEKGSV
jgi:anti-anti-sigma factor